MHTEKDIQLLNHFATACNASGLMISLKKTRVMEQDVVEPPTVCLCVYHKLRAEAEAVSKFMYPGLYNL